jgi:hypothetical protein
VTLQRKLDRNAKRALAALVVITLAVIVLALRGAVLVLTPEQMVAAPTSEKEQIVLVGMHTMIVPTGSIGSKIVAWLQVKGGGTRAFAVDDQGFLPGSDEPSAPGLRRVELFAEMMRGDPSVKARVIVSGGEGAGSNELAVKRAARIRAELATRGISSSRTIIVAADDPTSNQAQPAIVVVLSK